MKKQTFISKIPIFTILLILALAMYLYFMFENIFQGYKVQEGQIWIKEYNTENPFEQIQRDTIVIMSVKGEYCQYKKHGEVYSDRRYWIPVNGRLLK